MATDVSVTYRIPKKDLIMIGESIALDFAARDPEALFQNDLNTLVASGLSLSDIGQVIGVGRQTVHYWSLGHTPIDPLTIQVIAEWAKQISDQSADLPLLRPCLRQSLSLRSLGSLA